MDDKKIEHYGRIIIDSSNDQFLYGNNRQERADLLKTLAEMYPVTTDKDAPMGIYISDSGLPEVPESAKGLNQGRMDTLSSIYVELLIESSIADSTMQQVKLGKIDIDVLNKRMRSLSYILGINPNTTFKEFCEALKGSKDVCAAEYQRYIETGNILGMPSIAIDATLFANVFKRDILNNKSHFSIIFDQQEPYARPTQRAIDRYIAARGINGDLSVKIACEPDAAWDFGGMNLVLGHDYTIIKIDDSVQKKGNVSPFR